VAGAACRTRVTEKPPLVSRGSTPHLLHPTGAEAWRLPGLLALRRLGLPASGTARRVEALIEEERP